ncbi:helix-turn-helix domain-containing protein [Nocardia asiatica]|uniref:helix-turn-helix domain-containing protein n=1 Tax=Nocardia asiatica TaxID=209252 RepID=UPI002454CFD5|nr:helix-turn-helix transcriptional regulator [Nocardia asiatica]
MSPEEDIEQARQLLGRRLRDLRRASKLTGRDLAREAGWHGSKVTRFEHGSQLPTPGDLETWCAITGSGLHLPDLLAAVRNIDAASMEARRTDAQRRGQQRRRQPIDVRQLARIEACLAEGGQIDATVVAELQAAGLPELARAITETTKAGE